MSAPARQRVLIAEDEPVCSIVVQRIIEKAGYEVVVVKDGLSALREAEKGDFFAVIADWMLPELDGIEVVRRVVGLPGSKTKAFLTSVIDIPAAREHAVAAGAQDFLSKPITPAALMKALRSEMKPVAVKAPEGNHPMTRVPAWAALPTLAAGPISDLLGSEVSVELATEEAEVPVAITCGLADSVNGSELTSWILARESAAKAIATAMLGEAPESLTDAAEASAEILNVVVGIVKAQFATHGFKFTIELPKRVAPGDIARMRSDAFASIVTKVTVGDTSFTLGFTARSAHAVELRVEDLREGHVLAEDVKNAAGTVLLLPACTRLTANAAQRLRENCKGRKIRVHRA